MMSRTAYYQGLKALAAAQRRHYGVQTHNFGLREVRGIYKNEGIRLDLWSLPSKVKAVYMCDDDDFSVAVQESLPYEPKLFALIHELKHHYTDRDQLNAGVIHCGDYNANELIEKGAEVFAAEFIYPEAEFVADVGAMASMQWQPGDVVRFKRNCGAKVSFRFICKRLERIGCAAPNAFAGVAFRKLEDEMFGVPYYRRRRSSDFGGRRVASSF